MNKTITWIADMPTSPGDTYGNYYINLYFADDTAGYIAGAREKAEAHHDALSALVNQEAEFLLEEKGRTNKGKVKFKILAYPGYVSKSAQESEGGRSPVPMGAQAPPSDYSRVTSDRPPMGVQPVSKKDEDIARAVALKAAANLGGHHKLDSPAVLQIAERFLEWLQSPTAGPTSRSTRSDAGEGGHGNSSPAPTSLPDGEAGGEEAEGAGVVGTEEKRTDGEPPAPDAFEESLDGLRRIVLDQFGGHVQEIKDFWETQGKAWPGFYRLTPAQLKELMSG